MVLGFAAVNTGNNLLYLMVSALLGFMAISGLMGHRNLKTLDISVLPGVEIFAGRPAHVEIKVTNRRTYLPAFLVEVAVGDCSRLFPILIPRESQRLPLSLTFSTRGYHPLPAVWVKSRFPINFFIRSRRLPNNQRILAFPTPLAVQDQQGTEQGKTNFRHELPLPGLDGELRNIDNYQPHDPLKEIHWKLSARHDEYKVKRLHRLGTPSVIVKLDDFSGTVEEQLGQCTFLIDQLIRHHNAVGLQLGEQLFAPQPGLQQRNKLLQELALYGHH